MPTVRTLTPRVNSNALPNAYQSASGATPDAFGAATGRALEGAGRDVQRLGGELDRTALTLQAEDNEREAKRLDVEYSAELRRLKYGDDNTPGYFSLSGQAALDARADTEQAIEDARKRIAAGTSNPRVREMFEDAASARKEREMGAIGSHAMRERKVANDAVAEARLNEAADDAAAAPNDPKVIGQSKAIIRQEVAAMGERNGWAPEVTQSKMEEALTLMHKRAIDAVLVHDPSAAKAYYEANKTEIDGSQRATIGTALEAGTSRQESQAAADTIMARGLSEADALREARAIKDPKVRDETVTRVKARYDEIASARTAADRGLKEQAWAVIVSGGTPDDLPPSTLAALGQSVNSMWAAVNAREKRLNADPETDWNAYTSYMSMDRDELRGVNLERAKTELAPREFNQVRDRVRDALQGDLNPSAPFTPTAMFGARMSRLGLSNNQDDREEYGQALSLFQEQIALAEANNGDKKLTHEEVQNILDRVTDDVMIERSTKLGRWLRDPKETPAFDPDIEIPEEARAAIVDAFAREGIHNPTELEIIRAYAGTRAADSAR